VLSVLHLGVIAVLAVMVITNLLLNLTLLALAILELRKHIPLRTHSPINLLRAEAKEIRQFLLHCYVTSLSGLWTRDLDITCLGFFTEKENLGVYKLAKNMAVVLWQITDAALLVVYPEIARLWAAGQIKQLKNFIRHLSTIMGTGAIALYGAAFFVLPIAIQMIFGTEFQNAGILFRWMAWSFIVSSALVWLHPLMLATARTQILVKASILSGIILFLLYALASAYWGTLGAAIITGGMYIISGGITILCLGGAPLVPEPDKKQKL